MPVLLPRQYNKTVSPCEFAARADDLRNQPGSDDSRTFRLAEKITETNLMIKRRKKAFALSSSFLFFIQRLCSKNCAAYEFFMNIAYRFL
jgi:hypothetical protein